MRSVVSITKQAAEEAQENPKVAGLKERLISAYPRLFSGVANKKPPDRGRFGTARIKLRSRTPRSIVIESSNFRAIGPRP